VFMKGLVGSNPPFSQLRCIAYKSPLLQQDTDCWGKSLRKYFKRRSSHLWFGRSRIVRDLLEWCRNLACSDSVMLLFILIQHISGQAVSLMLIPEKCLPVLSCCNKFWDFILGIRTAKNRRELPPNHNI
jgi:hypothetical protein